jgi:hypothetical protein
MTKPYINFKISVPGGLTGDHAGEKFPGSSKSRQLASRHKVTQQQFFNFHGNLGKAEFAGHPHVHKIWKVNTSWRRRVINGKAQKLHPLSLLFTCLELNFNTAGKRLRKFNSTFKTHMLF